MLSTVLFTKWAERKVELDDINRGGKKQKSSQLYPSEQNFLLFNLIYSLLTQTSLMNALSPSNVKHKLTHIPLLVLNSLNTQRRCTGSEGIQGFQSADFTFQPTITTVTARIETLLLGFSYHSIHTSKRGLMLCPYFDTRVRVLSVLSTRVRTQFVTCSVGQDSVLFGADCDLLQSSPRFCSWCGTF